MSRGKLYGDQLMCPWHTFKFNVRTGVCSISPARVVRRDSVHVVDDEVFVALLPVQDQPGA